MQATFSALRLKFGTDAAAAAALGMTRQAFQQAKSRAGLSPLYTIRAAALLGLDPLEAILDQVAATLPQTERAALEASRKNHAAPIINAGPALPDYPDDTRKEYKFYELEDAKKTANDGPMQNVHVLTTPIQEEAIDLIKWVLAVARLPADSPRFAWYVSRWRVPEKIARAKAEGWFEEATAGCPPIDPAWVRFVPAALETYREFIEPHPFSDLPTPRNKPRTAPVKKARTVSSLIPTERKMISDAA